MTGKMSMYKLNYYVPVDAKEATLDYLNNIIITKFSSLIYFDLFEGTGILVSKRSASLFFVSFAFIAFFTVDFTDRFICSVLGFVVCF